MPGFVPLSSLTSISAPRTAGGRIVGIDLGTTNSVVAVAECGEPSVLPDEEGNRLTPSVVAFREGGQPPLVGHEAKRQAALDPLGTIYSVKRLMGMRFEEAKGEVDLLPYRVAASLEGGLRIEAGGKSVTPPEVSALVLKRLKEAAEARMGEEVRRAVITVPAYFNDSQRQATKEAGGLAGFEVARIINEPTAAALAYGLDRKREGKVAVYDLGGGTFDVSILEIREGVFEVLATSGDTHLGGDDFDRNIVAWALGEFERNEGRSFPDDPVSRQRLLGACEKAKCLLSTAEAAEISVPFAGAAGSGAPVNLILTLTRAKLEEIVGDLVEATRQPCRQALSDAGLKPEALDEVLLVGGQTRTPAVRRLVRDIFGREPASGIDPDEVVALGAAVQGSVLAGEVTDLLLLDVTPLSLGVETLGGVTAKLIPRNTTIPASHTEMFTTFVDDQTKVQFRVVQGEREMAADNRTLAKFDLTGIPPMPAGQPQIEVSFVIDQNGILSVSARETRSGREESIQVKPHVDLGDAEVEKMLSESVAHMEADLARRDLVEAETSAKNVLKAVEKALAEHGDLLEAEERRAIEEAHTHLRSVSLDANPRKTREATAALDKLCEPFAKRIMERLAEAEIAREQAEAEAAAATKGSAGEGEGPGR